MADKAEKRSKLEEREFIVEWIHLYRELPALWNVKSKEYRDRDKKNAAYETLLSKYKEMFTEATKVDVKKKINSLRTNYRKELKKHLQSMKSGSSTYDIYYEPTLWYYNEMIFLQDQECESDSQSIMDTQPIMMGDDEDEAEEGESRDTERSSVDDNHYYTQTQEDSSNAEDAEPPSTSYTVPETKAKKLKKKNYDELIELAAKRLRDKPDEYENWALACAADLKKMEPIQQIFAKNAIASIIMEGRLGLLHRHSVKINDPTIISAITSTPTNDKRSNRK